MAEEIKVLNVQFLTAARLTMQVDGETKTVPVAVDLANRKVYDNSNSMTEVEELNDVVFDYLDSATALPADFFMAGEDIQEKAQQAYDEIQRTKDKHLGDVDGWGSTTD